ncbi:hypothetical protein [uncultured Paludibaculum sp.]|uniref:hypothetical protein n=1 Tax=uncultured Paludibaculum sp. TaxID=1765020 RepID=UPI002AABA332|nr:hypothetical protein [uncultured Paludibaculum sp.]
MNDEPVGDPIHSSLDYALKKYGKIWIWSILMTLSAAESLRVLSAVSMVAVNPGRSALEFGMWVMAMAALVQSIAGFVALYWLYQFMRAEIVPMLFPGTAVDPMAQGGELLSRAMGAVVAGVGTEVAAYVLVLVSRLKG